MRLRVEQRLRAAPLLGQRSTALRSYLLILVAVSLLPVLGVAVFAVQEALDAYERAFKARLAETSQALALVVGRDFVAQLTALQTLATNPLLDLDGKGEFVGLEAFHERMVRAAAIMGTPMILSGPNGRILLHSSRPTGVPLPTESPLAGVRRVLETGQPEVGNLTAGREVQAPLVLVLVPVTRDGRVTGVLGATTPPERLSQLLTVRGLTEGWFAAAVDGNGVIVARSSRAEETLGRMASDRFLQARMGKADGIVEGSSAVTGEPVILAFRRLIAAPEWTVLVGESRAASAAEQQRPLLVIAGGGGVVLLLALSCAWWVATQILRDVRGLKGQAEILALENEGGSRPALAPQLLKEGQAHAVTEFAHLGQAMQRADLVLRDREERQTFLVHEVDHRARNALAVVQAVVRLTPHSDPYAFQRAVQGRVDVLARTHATLAKGGWRSADFGELLKAELAPYKDAVRLSGPALAISATAAQPIAMVIHELATNAAKHGALTVPGGSVSVTWWTETCDLHLCWSEGGGPAASGMPQQQGFGTRMINANVKNQLGGTLQITWQPTFTCKITVPLPRLLRKPDALNGSA